MIHCGYSSDGPFRSDEGGRFYFLPEPELEKQEQSHFAGLIFILVLGPLKVFDFFFARLPGAEAVAAQLYFIGRKR